MAFLYIVQNELRQKFFRNRVRLSDLTDEDIVQITRMPREAVQQWCNMLADELTRPTEIPGTSSRHPAAHCPRIPRLWQLSVGAGYVYGAITANCQQSCA